MVSARTAFSGFSVDDLGRAAQFYRHTLELPVQDTGMGLQLSLPGGGTVFVYPKPDHQPATFTILNFEVDDIDAAVAELTGRGVVFLQYPGLPMAQETSGIARGDAAHGPSIAWFTDPAGNILAVLQNVA
jgi:predicted enzyme related to lactoylglutathione lyase